MKLREKQMRERRNRILDSAEQLIRKAGTTDFSIRALATASEVSPVTPFNLFKSKEGLLYALLLRSLDEFFSTGLVFKSIDPNYHVVEAADSAVEIFVSDPDFLRPLYQVLLGVSHPHHRPVFMERTFKYWRTAALSIPGITEAYDEADLDLIAHTFMAHFIGLLELWIHEDLGDKEFRNHANYGFILMALPLVGQKNLPKMRNYLAKAKLNAFSRSIAKSIKKSAAVGRSAAK